MLLLACIAAAGAVAAPAAPASLPTVIVVPVQGTVTPAMAAFLGRALKESRKYPDRVIVLELDTYGGEVDAAFRIVDTMLSVRDCPTVAYVKTKAISAGALIALSCQKLYMQEHTTLGDVAPLMMSEGGPKMLGEKFQAPIRAKFRILAKQNGYPRRLTEAMVTTGGAVYAVTFPDSTRYLDSTELAELAPDQKKAILSSRTVVKAGELLTMDDIEAGQLGFSRASVSGFKEMLKKTGYADSPIVRYRENWSEQFVKLLALAAPFLMMIGLALLYIEFKNPGLIVPGVVGAIFLALVFFGQYAVGLANYTFILLAVGGVILVAVEVLIFPAFGMLLMAGIAMLIASLVFSLQGFVVPRPDFPWQQQMLIASLLKVLGAFVSAGVLSFLFIRFGISGLSKIVRGPYLNDTLSDTHADSGLSININEGDAGVVLTALRPAGLARIGNNEYDVVADGEFIEKGTVIRVLQKQGTRIVVTRKQSS
ncbi:MAG: ATP-dependent Clp protease proteolytic subunit [Chitinispirillaceae bacterium]|nr:ATP-dependent Clp protease proteolytic subunit [Chitinispirillaceae bacterium]